jgi:hypothetical protein
VDCQTQGRLKLMTELYVSEKSVSLINSLSFIQIIMYLLLQEEDMKRKRILLTAREKQGIVNYSLERRELTPLT